MLLNGGIQNSLVVFAQFTYTAQLWGAEAAEQFESPWIWINICQIMCHCLCHR